MASLHQAYGVVVMISDMYDGCHGDRGGMYADVVLDSLHPVFVCKGQLRC